MQLNELSARSGVSAASIKYYLREGLLQHGEAITATRARYDASHLGRLELIQALRQIVGLGIEQIRAIVSLADGGAPRLEVLATVQRVVLRLEPHDGGTHGGGSRGADGAAQTRPGDAVVQLRGWPDEESDARSALDAQLALMDRLGIPLSTEILDAYSAAMDTIAGLDLQLTAAAADLDQAILTAAVGMHMHSQLLLKLLALAQASHAIRRFQYNNAGSPTAHVADVDGP
ncbi:MerR family transcriptional regulator [Arthrobacter celericrescens]|uniref:MerR family transcriptional regulator n=1 Tax=Arthrobacter celericrescens TaxID=2320851 RepID=UPI000EA3FD05|nr:MerR family transcriptional regulator [Arthrobacter celericrescens]